jgi:hypothetical protein
MLIVFGDDRLSGGSPDLRLDGVVPAGAPVDALDVRLHRYADDPTWIDGWRTGPFRNIAALQLSDLTGIDAATCCYSIRVDIDDPADLAHLQLAWAVAGKLTGEGGSVTLDVYAVTWHCSTAITGLSPQRPFTVQREVSVIVETEPVPRFGYPVHTRGMIKFGRPDLIAGVPADRIEETADILNQLARMLAEGHVLTPGRKVRVDNRRTLVVGPYTPNAVIPDVDLANDGLLLHDA